MLFFTKLLNGRHQVMLYIMQSEKHTLLWLHVKERVVAPGIGTFNSGRRGWPEE